MVRPHRSDRSTRALVRLRFWTAARRHRQDPESGQAVVEFALILFPLLLIVVGIIQFGIGLNYWLDMQRIANQGARWAAVNNWPPDCPYGSPSCTGTKTLQETLKRQVLTAGLHGVVTVSICYPSRDLAADPSGNTPLKGIGDPVKVHLEAPYKFSPITSLGKLTLRANATMRLEQKPTLITNADAPC
jgi:TadE-like protein